MPGKSPSLYDLKKTTVWFAISSLVLLISLVAMVLEDSTREWKHWQKEFVTYSREKAEGELQKARKAVDQKKLAALEAQLVEAHMSANEQKSKVRELEKETAALAIKITQTTMRYQNEKQFQDSDRYFLEEHRLHHEDEQAAEFAKRMEERAPVIDSLKRDLEGLQAEDDARKESINEITQKARELTRQIQQLTESITRLESTVKKLSPNVATAILNAPMLDFMKPTLQIQQIVLENLYDDYFFKKSNKVDRCTTCHLGIDQTGFEDAPKPFQTHPRLELFLSANSPHPAETFGCTTCHGGSGQSVSFTTAAHTPQSDEQAAEWKKDYGWREMTHAISKMLPLSYTEASCTKCHGGVVDVPQAPKLAEGRRLARTYGCAGCHKIEGFEKQWKVGPSLEHVQSKLEPDWIIRWLMNPKEFRASTKMPRIFHLENTSDVKSAEKSDASIAGIAAYLMKNSDPIALGSLPTKGNPEAGEALVKEVGCLGCHTAAGVDANNFGPELTGLGSKVTPEWLYAWLKDPKHYSSETRMPNMRLSNEEAAHITAYLLEDRNEKFESIRLPIVKSEVVDGLAMMFLKGRLRYDDAQAKLNAMSAQERLEFIGEKTIVHQGCFGCHTIHGFEDTKPIGTELTDEGSKDVHKLDFGLIHLDHTRQAWFYQKLKEPRIFDRGKEKVYHEKLRMPDFGFNDDQAERLTTFLLSLQKEDIPLEMSKQLDLREQEIERGRYLVAKFNCQGCHTLDGQEGKVRKVFDDAGNAPPLLTGEGKKVDGGWLYDFLEKPVTIRPWLSYRMPTFEFDEESLTHIVRYFENLSEVPISYKDDTPKPTAENIEAGKKLFKAFQCIKCHKSNPEPGLSASFLAPDLVMTKSRLRPDWVVEWLMDPQALQEGTMMPTFFYDGQSPMPEILGGDALRQSEAIRDYLWLFNAEEAHGAAQPQVPQAG
ncbi:MAG: c-type cytochrome [Candidatus Omnitrophota bacterium]|nr:c-type cytochrome [Candidatus Omnitrophota bacterium]